MYAKKSKIFYWICKIKRLNINIYSLLLSFSS